jgi:hypothetical protein
VPRFRAACFASIDGTASTEWQHGIRLGEFNPLDNVIVRVLAFDRARNLSPGGQIIHRSRRFES